VWDTALAANALIESGFPVDDPALVRAGEWMIDRQVTVPGDWQIKRPGVPPGGWPFQYHNDFYPDLDDSAMVMMALARTKGLDPRGRAGPQRGMAWFMGMQGGEGGWGSFDADNNRLILNNIPFADHGALLDPSTEDLTGRGLELHRDAGGNRRASGGAARSQLHPRLAARGGPGTAAGAPTTSTARGRCSADWAPSARMRRATYVQAGHRLARSAAERGRRLGRDACTPTRRPRRRAAATPSRARRPGHCSVCSRSVRADGRRWRGASATSSSAQGEDGAWDDPLWNGTGFPRVFYLKYHLYAKYFPLWALGAYRNARG
jgi:squalene-hopene/tetraprenyl-beta-curcumene cyclase